MTTKSKEITVYISVDELQIEVNTFIKYRRVFKEVTTNT